MFDDSKMVGDEIPEIAMNFDDFDFDDLTSSPLPEFDRSIQATDSVCRAIVGGGEDDNPNILHRKIPENATNVEDVDAMIAKQMMALSVEDREKVYRDVHGVNEGPLEIEEDIQAGLDAMQLEIEKLQDKEAYELTRSMDQHYVENRSFRLAFLRSVSYDPRKAAMQMVRHFQLKQDLFGKEKLALDIVQDDLDREAMDALYSGRGQHLDSKDRAGRFINMLFFGDVFSLKATFRRGFYNAMIAYRNQERQLNGTVVAIFALSNSVLDIAKHFDISKANTGFPLRAEAAHLCQYGSIPQEVFAVSKAAAPATLTVRTRTHCGTHHEVLASLAQYGIPPGTIPITKGFAVTNVEEYRQRLKELRSTERLQQPRRQKISVPSEFDVLFGKGVPCQMHPGNVELRGIVSARYKSYEKAAKGEKIKIAQEIVETIQQKSALFLRPDGEESWICVEDGIARKKVSNLFRTLRVRINNR